MKIKIPQRAEVCTLPVKRKRDSYKCFESYAYLLGVILYKNKLAGNSQNTAIELSGIALKKLLGDYKFYINNLIEVGYLIQVNSPYSYVALNSKGIEETYTCKGTYRITKKIVTKNGYKQTLSGHAKRYKLNTKFFGIKPEVKSFEFTNPILIGKLKDLVNKITEITLNSFAPAKNQHEHIKSLSIKPEVHEFLDIKYPISNIYSIAKYLRVKLHSKENLIAFLRTLKNTKLAKANVCALMIQYNLDYNHPEYGYAKLISVLRVYFKRQYRNVLIRKYEAIARGEHDFLRFAYDNKTNRLFTLITETPKDIMPFVEMDNEELVEMDGKNTQWTTTTDYLVDLVRIRKFYNVGYKHLDNKIKGYKKTGQFLKVKPIDFQQIDNYVFNTHRVNLSKELERLHLAPEILFKGKLSLNRNLKEFFLNDDSYFDKLLKQISTIKSDIENDSFRSNILEYVQAISPNYPIHNIKKDLFKWVLFGPSTTTYYKDNSIVKAFRKKYDKVLFAIEALKGTTDYQSSKRKHGVLDNIKFGYASYDRWKLLSVINQKKEADIFVMDSYDNITLPFLTKHDALYVKKSDADIIEKELTQIIKKNRSKLILNKKVLYNSEWRTTIKPIKLEETSPLDVIQLESRIKRHRRALNQSA